MFSILAGYALLTGAISCIAVIVDGCSWKTALKFSLTILAGLTALVVGGYLIGEGFGGGWT